MHPVSDGYPAHPAYYEQNECAMKSMSFSIAYSILLRSFFCQRREIDAHARYIYTLTVTQSSFILHLTQQILVCLLNHTQLQITIINQNIAIHLKIMHKNRDKIQQYIHGSFLVQDYLQSSLCHQSDKE